MNRVSRFRSLPSSRGNKVRSTKLGIARLATTPMSTPPRFTAAFLSSVIGAAILGIGIAAAAPAAAYPTSCPPGQHLEVVGGGAHAHYACEKDDPPPGAESGIPDVFGPKIYLPPDRFGPGWRSALVGP
jgi:hypothetical protein